MIPTMILLIIIIIIQIILNIKQICYILKNLKIELKDNKKR